MTYRIKSAIWMTVAIAFVFVILFVSFLRDSEYPAAIYSSHSDTTPTQAHPSHSLTTPTPAHSSNSVTKPAKGQSHFNDFRLLIGVMSPYAKAARREIIRLAYNQFNKDLPVDVFFVRGYMKSPNEKNADKVREMQYNVSRWENETYGDILQLECEEHMHQGKIYEYFTRVATDWKDKYTHVMKADDDSFINIPALVEVIHANNDRKRLYWGTNTNDPSRIDAREMWGSGYVLGMDLVQWIATSDIPPNDLWGTEDWKVYQWLLAGNVTDGFVYNVTAFAGYPWPELGDDVRSQENEVRPFDRWSLVTHPLKEDFMWVETAEYYLGLEW